MGLFDKLREPVVLKEDSDAKKQLEQLNNYLAISPATIKTQIEQDIKLLQIGLYGEEAVMFELKNSHMPMYIMHDLFFEFNGLKTQIDYLIVTRNITVIIECKNLYGNITIDKFGNFTRTVQLGKNYIKKGIYSPVTQNQRHLDMIHEIRRNEKNILLRSSFDKYFNDNYKSIIVLANPNSVLEMKYAPKDIQNKIVKVDGLISYIKTLQGQSNSYNMSDKEMKDLADFFLEKSVPNEMDYTEKYRKLLVDDAPNVAIKEEIASGNEIKEPIENTELYKALKKYRLNKSKIEGVKAYFIYNNTQLEEIIIKAPKSIEDLKKINGFGDVKCTKYGNDILQILEEYCSK